MRGKSPFQLFFFTSLTSFAGGDYGHHMSRAACNIAAALMSEELKEALGGGKNRSTAPFFGQKSDITNF